MIERMKKLTFLVTNSEYDSFIEGLRQVGVVHVQQLQEGATSPQLQAAMDLERRYQAALDSLAKYEGQPEAAPISQSPDLLTSIEEMQQREGDLRVMMADTTKRMNEIKAEWTDRLPEDTAQVYEMAEACKRHAELAAKLQAQEQEAAQIAQTLAGINANCRPQLEAAREQAVSDITLRRVQLSGESMAQGHLHLMQGWARADRTQELTAYLDQNHIYYQMDDPAYGEDVPVELTEDGYSRLFLPILKMYSLPNYHEIDPTVFFAPFFMLFFGLCLGDGGYGMLVMAAGAAILAKGGDLKDYGKLALWLGGCTTVCGLAMGTFFGIDLSTAEWAFLAPVRGYFISDNGMGPIFGYSPMMVISVIIGLVQVLIGMTMKGAKAWMNYGFGYAVGTLSWVVALIGAVVLYGLPFCGVELHQCVERTLLGVIGVACVGIFLYNSPAAYKNPITGPLLNLGSGAYSVYGMATGLLGDLLSYIRLFALGLTGGVLGGVFNSLALDMTSSMPLWVRWLPMIVILLFGHGITFALSLISAFVHPMRLIFVEFFKNADFAGGGKPYQPFKQ